VIVRFAALGLLLFLNVNPVLYSALVTSGDLDRLSSFGLLYRLGERRYSTVCFKLIF